MLEKVKQFVKESFEKGINYSPTQLVHFERTIYWMKILKPDADEAMQIAAYAHDIARGFRQSTSVDTFKHREFNDPEYLKDHQEGGAEIISKFLKENDYPDDKINLVYNMVAHHEVGVDENSNLLMDADSLSFLENNVLHFIDQIPKQGKEKIQNKIAWMYDRISSEKAKELAKPYYDKAIEALENYQTNE
ncbi:MAG: DUF4202 family protein [Patescibacteria group bacterium]|jgi:hypothetical protein